MTGARPNETRGRRGGGAVGCLAALALLVLLGVGPGTASAEAQSVLDRPPNMNGSWAGVGGTLYFNVMHRFTETGPPLRKVINYPMILVGGAIVDDVLLAARYSTNSELVPRIPNEWEFFARYTPLRAEAGFPVTISGQAGYNHAAESFDGEISLERRWGPVLLLGAGRLFSDAFAEGETRVALAGGATVRLTDHIALAGDYARLLDLDATEGEPAWSAGLQLAIPTTPHTLSLQVGNTSTTTLQGSSLGADRRRWGFEFTVPVTLSRYFGSNAGPAAVATSPGGADPGLGPEVGMTNGLEFTPATVRIQTGETVVWRNTSDIVHTVTGDPSKAARAESVRLPDGAAPFDSGDMRPGATFTHTFDVPGEYRYVCLPHEAAGMVGTVIVTEAAR